MAPVSNPLQVIFFYVLKKWSCPPQTGGLIGFLAAMAWVYTPPHRLRLSDRKNGTGRNLWVTRRPAGLA